MKASWVDVGAVFRWSNDDSPMRVLTHDGDVVMFDVWWPHLGNWGLADLQKIKKQRINYYVTVLSTLVDKATYVRTEPLTDDELATHRPDLPFSVAQCAGMRWPSQSPDTAAQLAERWRSAGCLSAGDGARLNASEIYLYPFGPSGGQKAGVRVKADNRAGFTTEELIWKAVAIQAPCIRDAVPTHGIGIYRSGLHRGIPAYYLWGHESQLHSRIAPAGRQ